MSRMLLPVRIVMWWSSVRSQPAGSATRAKEGRGRRHRTSGESGLDLRGTDRPGTGEGRRCPVLGCHTHDGRRFLPSSRSSWLAPSAIGQIIGGHAVTPREGRETVVDRYTLISEQRAHRRTTRTAMAGETVSRSAHLGRSFQRPRSNIRSTSSRIGPKVNPAIVPTFSVIHPGQPAPT